ncbi:ATP-binding protein [Desulfoplanes formicivorans]|uniref:endopeptidase La n=1 Tax=Desulfoplanes formicivorans TaxID=1592317 RepID=A0A194AKY3_9BACT|nr:ATP-binding protein [Desulfoplanes formicivorans]GAU09701.1 ATP-dependent protease [Desulfoplanes formicivorans]
MSEHDTTYKIPVAQLRWRMDPADLPFDDTSEIDPLTTILGQDRAIEALHFGIGMRRDGYNIFVTGQAGTGRTETVRQLVEEVAAKQTSVPDDLCYLHNFKHPEAPVLLRLPPGKGQQLKKDMHDLIETLKKEVPQLFESQEYINRKTEISDAYEKKTTSFFMALEKKVKEAGFALVTIQGRQGQPPDVMPLVDGEPMPLAKVEQMVEKGRFPKDELAKLKHNYQEIRQQIDATFRDIRALQKEIYEKNKQIDHVMFTNLVREHIDNLTASYDSDILATHLSDMIEDMLENMRIFQAPSKESMMAQAMMPVGDPFTQYTVNVLTDHTDQKGVPVIVENYPTYRNLFGSIERIVDRSGMWRTDFSKIKAGSFIKANGGYLIVNLMDALMEPGVWPALKRALKSRKMEIETYDPFYLFTTTGLKPEPIDMDVKVIVLSNRYVYSLLRAYDEDTAKIFKVRADFDQSMDKTEESILSLAAFVRSQTDKHGLKPFGRMGVGALVEQAVRMAGRQEKIATTFPLLGDLILEADYFATQDKADKITDKHVHQAIEARITRSNLIEEKIQEMINRGSIMIDTQGAVVGQVNGLAVYALGDYMFGKPSRITATTSMGKAGIINIEREADLSGATHNKGVLILSGYLRDKYAQDKPLAMSASIAFEQSYSGVDGDSASSTEVYALLSSLADIPIKQGIAVTGSVNQKGEIQAIGGVNQKIEGFYSCCKHMGLTGEQGVIIPQSNVKDLMLRHEVVEAVAKGTFHIWAVSNVDEGMRILTGTDPGTRQADGRYPQGSINHAVDAKLTVLAEGLKKFGTSEDTTPPGKS